MKLVTRALSLLVLASLTFFYVSCDKNKGDNESVQSIQFKKLTGTWAVISASDGTDRTADFSSMTLMFSGSFAENGIFQYTVAGTLPNPSPWPKGAGNWKFGTDPATEIIRDADTDREIPCEYVVSDDGSSLTITFNIPDGSAGFPGGRIESVTGDWTFNFAKQ